MNEEGRYPCPRCNRPTYKRRTHLIRHLKYECGVEPKFACLLCGRKFKQNVHLKSHTRYMHGIR